MYGPSMIRHDVERQMKEKLESFTRQLVLPGENSSELCSLVVSSSTELEIEWRFRLPEFSLPNATLVVLMVLSHPPGGWVTLSLESGDICRTLLTEKFDHLRHADLNELVRSLVAAIPEDVQLSMFVNDVQES
jgi:hypothetical protein